jgi:TolB-like protein
MTADTPTPTEPENSAAASGESPASESSELTQTATEDVPTMAALKGVRYIGRGDVRKISADDLVRSGVNEPKGDLVWNAKNEFFVPANQLNAATRDFLATQSDFRIE